MMTTSPCPKRESLREEIRRDIEDYLANGGTITVLRIGESAKDHSNPQEEP